MNPLLIGTFQLQLAALLLLAVVAFWKGGGPERAVALVPIGMGALDLAYHAMFGRAHYAQIDAGHFAIDTLAAAAYVVIALRANRIYPIWLAAWQLIAVISHLTRGLSPTIAGKAYSILIIMPSYALIGVQALGLALHLRRTGWRSNARTPNDPRPNVRYRSWRVSSSRSQKPDRARPPEA